jgi:hypothetical protein
MRRDMTMPTFGSVLELTRNGDIGHARVSQFMIFLACYFDLNALRHPDHAYSVGHFGSGEENRTLGFRLSLFASAERHIDIFGVDF